MSILGLSTHVVDPKVRCAVTAEESASWPRCRAVSSGRPGGGRRDEGSLDGACRAGDRPHAGGRAEGDARHHQPGVAKLVPGGMAGLCVDVRRLRRPGRRQRERRRIAQRGPRLRASAGGHGRRPRRVSADLELDGQTSARAAPDGLLSWRWDPQKGEIADKNNATDGDILVAWALAEGARRFGKPDVSGGGQKIAQAIGAQTLKDSQHGPILLPGAAGFAREDQPDGPVINLSYWVFPAFSTLKELAPEYDWDAVRAKRTEAVERESVRSARPAGRLAIGRRSVAGPGEELSAAVRLQRHSDSALSRLGRRRRLAPRVAPFRRPLARQGQRRPLRDRRQLRRDGVRRSTAPAIGWRSPWGVAPPSPNPSMAICSSSATRSTTRPR